MKAIPTKKLEAFKNQFAGKFKRQMLFRHSLQKEKTTKQSPIETRALQLKNKYEFQICHPHKKKKNKKKKEKYLLPF